MSPTDLTDPTDAFDPHDADRPLMLRCACGRDHAPEAHSAASNTSFIEATFVKALFPHEPLRRRFLQAVGADTREG